MFRTASPIRHRLPLLAAFVAVVATAAAGAAVTADADAKPRRSAPKVRLAEAWSASRGVTIDGVAGSRELELGRAALGRLRLQADEMFPGWTISFQNSKPNLLGMTYTRERRVEIYVRRDRPVGSIAHDVAHELGHVTDVLYNSESSRARYLELRGLPASTPWWTCDRCRDLQVGAGDFAETFAVLVGPKHRNYSELEGRRDRATMAQIAAEVLPPGLIVTAPGSDA